MTGAELITLAIGVLGVAGIIFSALRFNRDDTTALVGQQNTIVTEMKALMEELRLNADTLRSERDECREQLRGS